jgi:putative ABC transport system permease protein
MIKNYFKIAWRSLLKRKAFSIINIIGLAIGISASLVIFLLVHFDFSFDTQHKDADRIYRVVSESGPEQGDVYKNSGSPVPMQEVVQNQMSGVEFSVPFICMDYGVSVKRNLNVKKPIVHYHEDANIIFANSNYFKLIQYQWIAGNAETALGGINQLVLSEERARTYFPNSTFSEILGQQLVYNDSIQATITGIVKKLEGNTDFRFEEFISYQTVVESNLKNNWNWNDWGSSTSDVQLFVKLLPNVAITQFDKKLTTILIKNKEEDAKKSKSKCQLQPLSDIHFNADYDNFNGRLAHKPTLYALILVGILLLVLGCINFINLSTAQSIERAKEVGVRKCIGAYKRQLVFQFLTETFTLTLLATIVSLFLAPAILTVFSDFIPAGITASMIYTPQILIFLFLLVIFVALLSGIYPSFVLTKFHPVRVLKGQLSEIKGNKQTFRQVLTVSQFTIAQFFIMATLIVELQVHFSLNKDLGFKKEAIAFIQTPFDALNKNAKYTLIEKMKQIPSISKICLAGSAPSSSSMHTSGLVYHDNKRKVETDVEFKFGDADYFELYGLKILAGRAPKKSDTIAEYVINETYLKVLGFKSPAEAIGKRIDGGMSIGSKPIVGVVNDFHVRSTRTAIKPLLFTSRLQYSQIIHFAFPTNTKSADWSKSIDKINEEWKKLYPDSPFECRFFDEAIANFYKKERDTTQLLIWSSGLAIFISCLGLLGLVIFITNQRRKEIGVRKVLGASIPQLVFLLSKEFLKLVIISLVIATLLAWYFMHQWLQDYVYRINMPIWVFVATGIGAILIAFATTAYQSYRSAAVNPIKSLRTE